VKRTLEQLAEDPFHLSLRSHKLKRDLSSTWACTVDYHNRIIFDFVPNPNSKEDDILLLTMGTHDEVYQRNQEGDRKRCFSPSLVRSYLFSQRASFLPLTFCGHMKSRSTEFRAEQSVTIIFRCCLGATAPK